MCLQEQHQFYDGAVHGHADGAGVALYKVLLERAELFGRDGAVAERAEAGGDAVYGLVALHSLHVEVVAAMLYLGYSLLREHELGIVFEDFLYEVVGKLR